MEGAELPPHHQGLGGESVPPRRCHWKSQEENLPCAGTQHPPGFPLRMLQLWFSSTPAPKLSNGSCKRSKTFLEPTGAWGRLGVSLLCGASMWEPTSRQRKLWGGLSVPGVGNSNPFSLQTCLGEQGSKYFHHFQARPTSTA